MLFAIHLKDSETEPTIRASVTRGIGATLHYVSITAVGSLHQAVGSWVNVGATCPRNNHTRSETEPGVRTNISDAGDVLLSVRPALEKRSDWNLGAA